MRKVNERSEYTGQTPNIEKFVNFWAGVWEDDSTTTHRKRMEKIKQKVKERIRRVEDLRISEQELGKMIKKRKKLVGTWYGWNTNFWWKALPITWKKLTTIMQGWIEDPDELPTCLTIGRTVLISKTVDLSLEEEYRPITCLNTLGNTCQICETTRS